MQRRPRRESKPHRQWIAERPCLICNTDQGIDACHIKYADARICKPASSNIGMKADDRFCVPLCRMHHGQQHTFSLGERHWWLMYRLDPILLALALYSISGDDQEGDRIVTTTALTVQSMRGFECLEET